ncbi:THUMP domain-containing protein 1 isoform X2 [Latimeria chalumnae]|nr:PREDICTED: THUMP domain-containing protein 1 [Latimeria chalumnae]XP_005999684.1 PREDICTED: THUMP domain-containing protein 1 [Latimeria chalumnae]XP_005999685.1 PREDICTED: THUMP domain-containing protein 1 [Latimeria chalumnae]XP_005999686.1 PREDICTED: THUMP domain-containing protein 1 [Latimeria chalumnae]XP_005999687.1 PREDICTED: THUMP domain-containing protein 1 [Latimeria chalumnae]|eukprot:XP_005999683.1 PREDICTED: THUMP domain-containing protein 1 [Latimeria chalumnae]
MMSEQKGRKRSRAQYMNHGKRQKGGRELEVGMQGILITCNMNERKCTAEAYSLLNEYADQLYGPEKFGEEEGDHSESEEGDEDDAEAALKKEVDQIRASTEKKLRRFQAVESGANNVVFLRTLNIEPEKLVHHILQDLHTTKKKKTRVILRMLPIAGTCKAFMEDMKKYFQTFLDPWFKAPNKGTFQIVYKARNNDHLSREEVIKALAGIVGILNPENKVDLTNPEYTVVVEIIKSVCCVSVVRDYVLYRKYNLQEVVKGSGDRGGGSEEAAAAAWSKQGGSGEEAAATARSKLATASRNAESSKDSDPLQQEGGESIPGGDNPDAEADGKDGGQE